MRAIKLAAWAVACLGAWRGADAASPASPVPDLDIPLCAAAPRLDGSLDDAAWAGAAVVTTLREAGADGAVTDRHRVKLARDDAWLYVGFRVEHPVLDRNPPIFRAHDEDLQREDNVQVSFRPGRPDDAYYQFLLSPANVRADWRMARGTRDRDGWNIPWRSAARADDNGWTAELALPLGLLLEGGDAGAARLNVLVDQFVVERDVCAAQVGVRQRRWSWAALAQSFDEPARFMRVRGLEGVRAGPIFLPYVEACGVRPYGLGADGYYYEVRAEVRDRGGQGGRITLSAADSPAQGAGHAVEQALDLDAAGTPAEARIRVPVDTLGARKTVLSLRDAAGEVWQTVVMDDPALEVFSGYLDRDYYTTEPDAGAVCRVGLPAEGLAGLRLRARTADGRVLAEAGAQAALTLPIPLADLDPGAHALALELCKPDGSVMTRQDLSLLKRAPGPGSEWQVDRVNRVLLRDGAPFFPFGLVMGGVAPGDGDAFRDAAALGANSIYHWRQSALTNLAEAAAEARAYLDAAAAHGLQVVFCPDKYAQPVAVPTDLEAILTPEQRECLKAKVATPRGRNLTTLRTTLVQNPLLRQLPVVHKGQVMVSIYEQQAPILDTVIEAVRGAPNLMAYNIFDEPNVPGVNQDLAGRAYYRRIHDRDGYHPVMVVYNTLWDSAPYRERITGWCDVLVQDPYWIPAGGRNRPAQSQVTHVATMVARTKRLADSARRVTMTVPQAELWSGCRKRALTPAEQRCQTYLALIHGSKGLFYFVYPLASQAMAETLAQLGAELKVLGPACLTTDLEQAVRYEPGELDPVANKFTDVQVTLRRHPEGGTVLLAANTAYYPVDTAFTVSGLEEGGTVTRLFGDETYAVTNGAFRDQLEGFGTRAYRIETRTPEAGRRTPDAGGRRPDEAVSAIRISVAMTPRPELAVPEPTADAELNRAGKKNLLPNSSFEQATLPGWPDYYCYMGTRLAPEERIGGAGGAWGLDSRDPYHGQSCLRMGGAGTGASRQTYIEYNIDPALSPEPAPFTLSTWMRASRKGVAASLYVSPLGVSTNIALTTEWQRYRLPFTMPARTGYLVIRWYFSQSKQGDTVWLDAAQMETGMEPTEYEP